MRKDKFNEVVKSYLYSIYAKNLKEIKLIKFQKKFVLFLKIKKYQKKIYGLKKIFFL